MAYIKVPDNLPRILGPMAISPESTKALRELAEVLLRGPKHADFRGTRNHRHLRFVPERLLFLPAFPRSGSSRASGRKLRTD